MGKVWHNTLWLLFWRMGKKCFEVAVNFAKFDKSGKMELQFKIEVRSWMGR